MTIYMATEVIPVGFCITSMGVFIFVIMCFPKITMTGGWSKDKSIMSSTKVQFVFSPQSIKKTRKSDVICGFCGQNVGFPGNRW